MRIRKKRQNAIIDELQKHPAPHAGDNPLMWVLRYKFGDKYMKKELSQYLEPSEIRSNNTIAKLSVFAGIVIGFLATGKVPFTTGWIKLYWQFLSIFATAFLIYTSWKCFKYGRNKEFYGILLYTLNEASELDEESQRRIYESLSKVPYPTNPKLIHKIH